VRLRQPTLNRFRYKMRLVVEEDNVRHHILVLPFQEWKASER
jgi:hypothetical protein